MSDEMRTEVQSDTPVPVSDVPLTAGAMLRRAREASGLHVAALAVSMKVPVKKLEALEADKLNQTMDAVFVRALASSMCRALKIDATAVLEKLPQSNQPKLQSIEKGINAPFNVPGQRVNLSAADFFAKPVVLAVLALVLGALVLLFIPDIYLADAPAEAESTVVSAPAVSVPEIVTPAAPEAVATAPEVQISAPVPAPVPAPVQATVVVLPPPVVAEVMPATAASEPAKVLPKVIRMTSQGTSWLEVIDAKGGVQVRRTLLAGESVEAAGVLPLTVVIGRADVIAVEVRGKPFSLVGIAKDNVARFEVK
jgi:cytoskeleton protein RodZ